MRLFLVRHGETVDNVAGIYAGTRDSPLTAHGALQAHRLGAHLAAALGPAARPHVFASDLRRAAMTAQAVVDALAQAQAPRTLGGVDGASPPLRVVQLRELRERDFGRAEGRRFGSAVLGDAGAESWDQMRVRAERFVRVHLVPVLEADGQRDGAAVVVVAHGLILDALLRVLLAWFGRGEAASLGRARTTVWSNTGYVEAVVTVSPPAPEPGTLSAVGIGDGDVAEGTAAVASGDRTPTPGPKRQRPRISLSVVGVNVLKHLEGLKKTRGGIGSAQFDKRQRTVDSFFGPAAKKTRVDREPEEA
ncbi:0e275efa-ecda-4269-bb09-4eae43938cb6 [Thermothielavioides terrestris]|uniref:0e275efa-ecda-4269-bb09-4eae43938cb6 n=1 Tax=Thermothielavioides terrestris TaxID=2587410 RepID=A0A3S4AVR5_9PEZI|nr:0e275efa-ecda-4269-bb09-4eae43938cb6 [Thermothielavioides terrestris]